MTTICPTEPISIIVERISPDPVCPIWCVDHHAETGRDGSVACVHYGAPTDIVVGSDSWTEVLQFTPVRSDDDGHASTPAVASDHWVGFLDNWADLLGAPMDATSCRALAVLLLHLADVVES